MAERSAAHRHGDGPDEADTAGRPPRPPVERSEERLLQIGLLLADRLDRAARRAVLDARDAALARLRGRFPDFTWEMPIAWILLGDTAQRAHPAELIDEGVQQKHVRRWDFVLVVTGADLVSYYRPYALAASSRAVDAGVVSLARLRSTIVDAGVDGIGAQDGVIAGRLTALMLHVLLDLVGVGHCRHPECYSSAPETTEDLDGMQRFCPDQDRELVAELDEIADLRVEEAAGQPVGAMSFYIRSIRANLDDIRRAVIRARPWEFPLRLGRVTTAAMSSLAILMLTAEVWELGARQPSWRVAAMTGLALLGSTAFVVTRHRLLEARGGRRRTEQIAASNVTMTLVVLIGIGSTYLLVWCTAVAVSWSLFDTGLVRAWTGRALDPPRLRFAGFVASFSIVIGALGSTFEGRYFRHVAFVDEET